MHLWQYEAQFGFCFRLDLATLGQANMLRRKPISGILAGSLALLKLLSSPIRNLLLTSPPWFTRIHTDINIFAVRTSSYWRILTFTNMETEDGPPHVAWWCSLPPAPPASPCRASCEKNQYFLRMNDWKGLERIGKDWKGLERIGKDWKELERIGKVAYSESTWAAQKVFLWTDVYWVFWKPLLSTSQYSCSHRCENFVPSNGSKGFDSPIAEHLEPSWGVALNDLGVILTVFWLTLTNLQKGDNPKGFGFVVMLKLIQKSNLSKEK